MTPRFALFLAAALASLSAADAPVAKAPEAPPAVPTVIESGTAEMVSTEKETTFTFSKGVKVTATNMELTCADLIVIATRVGDPKATLGDQQNFKSLVATGGVRIVQQDREALAQRAEVFPGEDKVILSGDPVVRSIKDGWQQTAPGMQLILFRGERRAVIPEEAGKRVRIALPPLKDLGYDKDKPKAETPPAAAPPPAADAAPASDPAPAPTVTFPRPAPQ